MTDVSLEIAAVSAAFIAAAAAIWQGVLTRRALAYSREDALAQERLVRLSNLYSALLETKSISRRAIRRKVDDLTDEEIRDIASAVKRVRVNADLVALAYDPGTFGDLYSRIADFLVFVGQRTEPPPGMSVLEHMDETAKKLADSVFKLSAELNQSRKG